MKLLGIIKFLFLLFMFNALILGTMLKYDSNYFFWEINSYLYLSISILLLGSFIFLISRKLGGVELRDFKPIIIVLTTLLLYFFLNDIIINHFELNSIKNYSIYIIFCIMIIFYGTFTISLSRFIEKVFIIFYFIYISFYIIYFSQNIDVIGFRISRPGILLGNANEDGGLLSILFVVVLFSSHLKSPIKYSIILLHFYVLIFLNGTRTSIIASIIVLFFFFYNKFVEKKSKKKGWIFLILSLIIFTATFYFLGVQQNQPIDMEVVADDTTLEGRYTGIWYPTIMKVIQESPAFGFGNNLDLSDVTYDSSDLDTVYLHRSFHNFFIQYLYKWGIIGFILLLYFIHKIFLYSKNARKISLNNSKLKHRILSTNLAWFCFILWSMMANSFSVAGWFVICSLFIFTLGNYKEAKLNLIRKHLIN